MQVAVNGKRQYIGWSNDDGIGLPPIPADGMVVQLLEFDSPPPPPHQWSPALLTFAVPVRGDSTPVPTRLTKTEFQWRFTLAEQVALKMLESPLMNSTQATLTVMRESLVNATGVDPDDARTQGGAALMVDALVSAGLVAANERDNRLAEILAPVVPFE